MQGKANFGNPVLWPLAALLIAALLLVGLTSSASAGNGDGGAAQAAKKKCKRHSKASGQASKRKKCRPSQKTRFEADNPAGRNRSGAPGSALDQPARLQLRQCRARRIRNLRGRPGPQLPDAGVHRHQHRRHA